MTGRKKGGDYIHQPRRDRMDEERVSDPYRARGKWPEPTACPECGAIFHHGHWQWGAAAPGAAQHLCPACQRMRDRVPAGQLTLSGQFFTEHREEVLHLVRNAESKARAEHPLERIMDIKEEADHTVVTFTDAHLVHGIGEALHHAYQGELDSRYTDEGDLLRVAWSR
ncbi:MAG: ATPase [Candidatus Muproteobacteria bacterium RBG_16_65_34]|uniref:ATPase n=1 Tax=Candidatus Muproteobacteria bacterium RBG_16_65_34 TaxID=1817760 RepID=A0A1F6TJX4_9PROT|nr:MAG: ATPase [Candidatus Muproteobacteria bacterium RBG_16_65_34]